MENKSDTLKRLYEGENFAGTDEDLIMIGFNRLDQYLLGTRLAFVSSTFEMLLNYQDVDKDQLQGAYSDITEIIAILNEKGLRCDEIVGEGL